MSDDEAIQILARRGGWKNLRTHSLRSFKMAEHENLPCEMRLPDYLNSRDALVPLMDSLTPVERGQLHDKLCWLRPKHFRQAFNALANEDWTIWLLTLPPRELAFAIAEVLKNK